MRRVDEGSTPFSGSQEELQMDAKDFDELPDINASMEPINELIREAVAREREACAKVAEERFGPPGGICGEDGEAGALIAKSIRARKDGG